MFSECDVSRVGGFGEPSLEALAGLWRDGLGRLPVENHIGQSLQDKLGFGGQKFPGWKGHVEGQEEAW